MNARPAAMTCSRCTPELKSFDGSLDMTPRFFAFDRAARSGLPAAAFGVVISDKANASALLQAGVGITTTVGVAAWEAFRDWSDERDAIERNQMFFCYSAERELLRNG
jgi:hypothetical protein